MLERCRRHGPLLEVFFQERAVLVRGIGRLRRRHRRFDELFRDTEEQVVASGIPAMFTLRTTLRELHRREQGQPFVADAVAVAERANDHMRSIVDRRLWPSRAEIGWTGSFAAAALIAHADDDVVLRREAISRMRVAVENDGVDARYFAHIVDRANAMDGRPQAYGTLFVPVDGEPRFVWPIAGVEDVAAARCSIRLPSVAEDQLRYQRGARPGPFLVPYLRRDWVRLYAHIILSGLRHGRPAA